MRTDNPRLPDTNHLLVPVPGPPQLLFAFRYVELFHCFRGLLLIHLSWGFVILSLTISQHDQHDCRIWAPRMSIVCPALLCTWNVADEYNQHRTVADVAVSLCKDHCSGELTLQQHQKSHGVLPGWTAKARLRTPAWKWGVHRYWTYRWHPNYWVQ